MKCKEIPTDGCFCPEGKVMLNGTCVPENHCEVCDDKGHHPGDVWQEDACTKCTCDGTNLQCESKSCPSYETVCEKGFSPVKVPPNEKECCDKFICVPVSVTASPTCEPPHNIACAPDQILKLDTKADGCQQFVCQCKPPEQCDPIDTTTDKPLEDGYVKKIKHEGCCPSVELECKPELCPKPPVCQLYYELKNNSIPGKCCSIYSCEAPKDKCIFETQYTASADGGERLQNKYEQQKLLKKV